jgi:hypothetical protein
MVFLADALFGPRNRRTMVAGESLDPVLALQPLDVAFREGLLEEGYVEGANVAITYRYAENRDDRLTEHW